MTDLLAQLRDGQAVVRTDLTGTFVVTGSGRVLPVVGPGWRWLLE